MTSTSIQVNNEQFFHFREQTQSGLFYNEDPVPGSGHGQYDRHRGLPPHLATDQYSESSLRSDPEALAGSYGRDYFSSEDLGGPEGHRGPPLAGRYGGGSSHKRPSIGQTYACQSSPTQPHPPEKKQFLKERDQSNDQDADVRHGLRSWRINSYLSTYEDSGEEGLAQPVGPDAFEDPPVSQPANTTDNSGPNFGGKEPPKVPPKPRPDILRPRFGKPVLSENKSKDSPPAAIEVLPTGSDLKPSVPEREKERTWESEREKERSTVKGGRMDMEVKEAPDLLLSKHESFRTRINPLLQRSSRLRSSLIFSSSKAEMHNSGLGLRPATEEDEHLDSVRTSSIVAQILEKRRTREPFEWRKRAEEKNKEPVQEKVEKEEKEPQEKDKARLKDELKTTQEPQKTTAEIKLTSAVGRSKDPAPPSLSSSESTTQQCLKDLVAKRKASKMEAESLLKAPEPAEKKPDLMDKPPLKSAVSPSTPSPAVTSGDPEPKKIDISAKLSELTHRHSVSSSKPPATAPKPPVSYPKPPETQPSKEENSPEGQKKDIFKSLKPLPSPKIFKKAPLKLKSLNPRRVSCGEEIFTTDATDAEKSELKKNRTQSSSTLSRDDFKEGLHKAMGSNTSINTLGEGKAEGKKHWLKGILGSKDKDKKSSAEDKAKNVVIEVTDETGRKQSPSAREAGSAITDQTPANNKTSAGAPPPPRYQSASSSVIFSSNLRDDTKVILEQISAHSQKNRAELEENVGDRGGDGGEKALERHNSVKGSRFLRPQGNIQEREGLLKRIESLRKEKKVYSRFEVL